MEVIQLADLPLFTKVLFVAGAGLAGVFLVLCLFYMFLRFMQRWS